LFESEAKRYWGVARLAFCNGPCVGAKKQASAPARCQPWTMSDSLLFVPSGFTPYGGPSRDFFPADKSPAGESSSDEPGFSACRMIMILVVVGVTAMVRSPREALRNGALGQWCSGERPSIWRAARRLASRRRGF